MGPHIDDFPYRSLSDMFVSAFKTDNYSDWLPNSVSVDKGCVMLTAKWNHRLASPVDIMGSTNVS
jgi:hypothetical protein